jgi:CubicO group peptidase (beta-lactamase class C family)
MVTGVLLVLMIALSAVAGLAAYPEVPEIFPGGESIRDADEWADFLHRRMVRFTEEENIPNAVIALVSEGRISLMQGYGHADMEAGIPVDPETHLFRVGSVSKIFTWAAVLQLAEKGQLSLDEDIRTYTGTDPDFRILFDIPDTEAGPGAITLRHLMSHSAGFANTFEGLFSFTEQPPLKQYLAERMPARIFPPGEVIGYSNYGTALAGHIVEQVSGMDFEDYISEHIFAPLGMSGSSFRQPLPGDLQPRMVNAYRYIDGEFRMGHFEHMPSPAGGLSTTARDMAQFLIANLNRGATESGAFMSPETHNIMHSTLFRYHPLTSGMVHGLMEYSVNGQTIIEHSGSSSIFDAGFYLFPGLDLGLFIAYSGGDFYGHSGILYDFLNEFFPTGHPADARVEPGTPEMPADQSVPTGRGELTEPGGLTTPGSQETLETLETMETPVLPAALVLYEAGHDEMNGEFLHSLRIVDGMDKVLNLAFGNMFAVSGQQGSLTLTVHGMDFVFDRIAPGIYKNTESTNLYPYGPMHYVVTARAPDGRLMLLTDGPASYIRVTWYESTGFALFILLPALLFAAGSLLFYLLRFLTRKIRRRPAPPGAVRPEMRWFVIAHALTLPVILMLFGGMAEPHPVHLMPMSFFGPDPLIVTLIALMSYVAAILALALIWLSVRAWINSTRTLPVRTWYSVYAIWAAGLVWLLGFYNFFGL